MPSSPHATDGTTYKIKESRTESDKEKFPHNTREKEQSKSNRDQETTSHVTRIQEKGNKKGGYRDPNRDAHLHTGHLQK